MALVIRSTDNQSLTMCSRFLVKLCDAIINSNILDATDGGHSLGFVVYKLGRIFQRATNEYGSTFTEECSRMFMLESPNVFATQNLSVLSSMSVEDMTRVLNVSFKLSSQLEWNKCTVVGYVCRVDDREYLQRYGVSSDKRSTKKKNCDFSLPPRDDFLADFERKPLHWTRQLQNQAAETTQCGKGEWRNDKLISETNQLAELSSTDETNRAIVGSIAVLYAKFAYLQPVICRA